MSDEEKTAVQIDFAQELTEPEETAEEKAGIPSSGMDARRSLHVVESVALVLSACVCR